MGKSGGLCPLVVSGVLSTRVPGRGEMCFRLRGRRLRSRIINYRDIFPEKLQKVLFLNYIVYKSMGFCQGQVQIRSRSIPDLF